MPDIIEEDVKLYKAEDQTDTDTGGGRMSQNVIVDGEVNNLVPNISRINRLYGAMQLRKIFQKIDSANTAVYSGAHLIVRDMPLDENVSVLMIPTSDHNDRRPDIIDYLESYYEIGTPAGNATLEYAVSAGQRQLVFQIRHKEYNPVYQIDGELNYLVNVNAKWHLDVSVGELIYLGPEGGSGEYCQVERIQTIHEQMDAARMDQDHYYIVDYLVVTLAASLQNDHAAGETVRRTDKNTAWKAYGASLLAEAAAVNDHRLVMASTLARLVPVIELSVSLLDQIYFLSPGFANDVAVGTDDIPFEIDNVSEIEVSEAIPVVTGAYSYTHSLAAAPGLAYTLEIFYRHNKAWRRISDAGDGTLEGYGTGTVDYDSGMISFSASALPDEGTHILIRYTRPHQYAEHRAVNLYLPDDITSEGVFFATVYTGAPGWSATLKPHLVPGSLSVYTRRFGAAEDYVLAGTDDGAGAVTGLLPGTVNYDTGYVSLTWTPVDYQRQIKVEYTYDLVVALSQWEAVTPVTMNLSYVLSPPLPNTLRIYIYSAGGRVVNTMYDNGQGLLTNAYSGTVDYDTGELAIDFSPGGYPGYTILIRYSTLKKYLPAVPPWPCPLTFGVENLKPESVYLNYITASGMWKARDDGAGALILRPELADWTAGGQVDVKYSEFGAAYHNGLWGLAVGPTTAPQTGNRIYSSVNGRTWTLRKDNYVSSYVYWNRMAVSDNGVWCAAGGSFSGDSDLAISSDLVSWTYKNLAGYFTSKDVVWSSALAMFVTMSSSAIMVSSDEGATWNSRVSRIASGMNRAISAQLAGVDMVILFGENNQGQYTTDGTLFTLVATQLGGAVVGAAVIDVSGTPTLYVIDNQKGVARTTDGITYTRLATDLSKTPAHLAGGNGRLVVVFTDGTLAVSTDAGVTWSPFTVPGQWSSSVSGIKVYFQDGFGWMLLSYGHSGSTAKMIGFTDPGNIMTDAAGDEVTTIGEIDYVAGTGEIFAGEAVTGVNATYFLSRLDTRTVAVHTLGADPVKAGTFKIRATGFDGTEYELAENITDPTKLSGDGSGTFSRENGYAIATFPAAIITETVRIDYGYGSVYHPEYEAINTRAMPLSGMVEIIHPGDVCVIVEHARSKLAAGIDDVEMAIDVEDGSIFPDREVVVTIEDEEITGTMTGNTFSVSARGYNSTAAAEHAAGAFMILKSRREEMVSVVSVAGEIVVLANLLLYAYKPGGAILTSAILSGDMQALVTDYHTQENWNGSTWHDSDEWSGNPADDAYDFTNHPVEVSNLGAETERFLLEVVSTGPVLVDLRGEHLGVIATDLPISSDIAVNNPNTSAPYFTLRAAGWGAGFQFGNILRLNTQMAGAPHWIARIINARSSDTIDDYATLQSRGDVAA